MHHRRVEFDTSLARRKGFQAYLKMPLNNEEIVVPDDFKTALDAVLKKALGKKGNEEYYDPQEPLVQDLLKILRDEADALGAAADDASEAQD